MMWDLSGGANGAQGSSQYHHQQARGRPQRHHFPHRGFEMPSAPSPFMPIDSPRSIRTEYSPSNGYESDPWAGVRSMPNLEPTPAGPPQALAPTTISAAIAPTPTPTPTPTLIPQSLQHTIRADPMHAEARPPPTPVHHQVQVPATQTEQRSHRFQLSRCTGQKKALCIGINYRGQANELYGCVNDARNVQRFLMHSWGYKEENIIVLTDDSPNPRQHPTRVNILDGMHWLVRNAHPHDSLFFHYSGHGGQVKDRDGDEVDGYDEIIFPLDHQRSGYIMDDLMHTILVKSLPAGCRLTALFDSCHSGSVLDLPYLYHSDGRVKGSQVTPQFFQAKSTPADVISWSGCKDSQTSADTFEQGTAGGAMSFAYELGSTAVQAFMSSLHRNPNQSYQELLQSVRVILRKKYSQKPQLSSSHRIDTSLKFIM
ncbi:Metacaspase-1 [Grifola frondosa]|uniref:Metacaspase-1 n=1 Tax=Grifola frondosa TaxID=5627 RepID=A0A1C7MMC2_GRIFR|nr:Metacaspase-1 [Grifola frondosa]